MKRLSQLLLPDQVISSKVPSETPVTLLTNDSSAVLPGACFFALRGKQHDGHKFLEAALKAGAAALVLEDPELAKRHERTVLVASTRHALGWAASRWYGEPSKRFDLVGVTGTNGKTTTAYLLKQVWDAMGLRSGMVGTVASFVAAEELSSTLTTPDPLVLQQLFAKMATADVQKAVIEVSSIALDQERVMGSAFDIGLFTNLTRDHFDYHGDFEHYFAAKQKLFFDYELKAAVINVDDPWGQRLLADPRMHNAVTFSAKGAPAVFSVLEARYEKALTEARIATPSGEKYFQTPLIGQHNLANALGVLATLYALENNLDEGMAALAKAPGAPGRLERVQETRGVHVFVDYAHTDDALANVLQTLGALRQGSSARLLTVFGCGGDRDRTKRPKMAEVASRLSDVTIATSDNPRTENPAAILDEVETGIQRASTEYHRRENRREAIALALEMAAPGDLILIAGKGHENYQIIGRETHPFDDREVVGEYYRRLAK